MSGRTRSKLAIRPARRTPAETPALAETGSPLVGIIMGSRSDWETMQHASTVLTELGVPHECRVVSAHRTPDLLFFYASHAAGRGVEVIIAGAGGAAHLPGMCASKTHLPVLGVPVQSAALSGMDSLLSIVQMPAGIPVGTLAIGKAGAINAGLLATAILCGKHAKFQQGYLDFRQRQTDRVLADSDLPGTPGAGGAGKKASAGSTAGAKR